MRHASSERPLRAADFACATRADDPLTDPNDSAVVPPAPTPPAIPPQLSTRATPTAARPPPPLIHLPSGPPRLRPPTHEHPPHWCRHVVDWLQISNLMSANPPANARHPAGKKCLNGNSAQYRSRARYPGGATARTACAQRRCPRQPDLGVSAVTPRKGTHPAAPADIGGRAGPDSGTHH